MKVKVGRGIACLALCMFISIPVIAKTVEITIPEQRIEVEIGEEFQIRGIIEGETELLLLHAVEQTELFMVCEDQFSDNRKHWIENIITFVKLGEKYYFGWEDVPEPTTLAEINKYLTGDTILWSQVEQKFVIGKRPPDIYFPEEPTVGPMKAVWSNETTVEMRNAGFNTIFNFNFWYGPAEKQRLLLDTGQEYGMKIVPVLHHMLIRENGLLGAVDLVKQWKDHPAWGGSMLLDEPQLNQISVAKQQTFYNAIKAADPDHDVYMAFFPDLMQLEYFSKKAQDRIVLNYYPVRTYGDWKAFIQEHLDAWLESTGVRDVIPNMQAFHDVGPTEFANPIGTLKEQWGFWVERNMVRYGYSIYAEKDGAGSGSKGIREIDGMLEEVTEFNEAEK